LLLRALIASLPGLPPVVLSSGEIQAAIAAFKRHQYLRALSQLRIAAAKGNCRAQCISGLMLWYGETLCGTQIQTDRAAAVRYLQEAVAQGDATAGFILKSVAGHREPRNLGMPARTTRSE
jgi:TPR repeat protein